MKKMRAAILRELGKPLSVEEVFLPALERGQVLVKVAFAGVCHTQVSEARGKRGPDRFLPHLLGHEASGTVVETGPGVERVRAHDRVVVSWIKSLGLDAPGPKYSTEKGESINAGPAAVFAEYAVVSENRCTPLPEKIPLDVAALLGCAVPTGAGIVLNQLNVTEKQSAAVFGVGGIGLCAVLALAKVGCRPVIAVDIDEQKLRLAREFGATHAVLWGEELPEKVDYAIEASGVVSVTEAAFAALKNSGELVLAGNPPFGARVSFDPYGFIFGKRVTGSAGGASSPWRDIPRFAEWYRERTLPLEKMIAQKLPLDQINAALDALEAGVAGRLLLEL